MEKKGTYTRPPLKTDWLRSPASKGARSFVLGRLLIAKPCYKGTTGGRRVTQANTKITGIYAGPGNHRKGRIEEEEEGTQRSPQTAGPHYTGCPVIVRAAGLRRGAIVPYHLL